MKRYIFNIFFILALGTLLPLNAQVSTKKLLDQMPVNSMEECDQLMAQMLDMSSFDRQSICELIVAPGTGDDTQARFAIESYSKYLSEKDSQAKKNWEQLIVKMLKSSKDKEVKAFFIRELEWVGSTACIATLKDYLKDEQLAAPAIKSMLIAAPKSAKKEIATALSSSSSPAIQVMLVKGLKGASASVSQSLISMYPKADKTVKKAILNTLAEYKGEDVTDFLNEEASKLQFNPEETGAVYALLAHIGTLNKKDAATAYKLAKVVHQKTTANNVKVYAMLEMSRAKDSKKEPKVLLGALKNADKKYRGAIVEEAISIKADAEPWAKRLQKEKRPEVQKELMYLLAQLKDKSVADVIAGFMSNKNAEVRAEAAIQYATLISEKALPALLSTLQNNDITIEPSAAKQALQLSVSADNMPKTLKVYGKLSKGMKAVMLEVWGLKGQTAAFDNMAAAISKDKELKEVALEYLPRVSGAAHLDQLLQLFAKSKGAEAVQISKALVKAAQLSEDKEAALEKIQTQANQNGFAQYMPVFSAIGGAQVVDKVLEQYTAKQSALALKALVNWGDYHAAPALYMVCSKENNPKADREKAFDAYVAKVASSSLPDDQRLLKLKQIMPFAQSDKQRTKVINAMGSAKTYLSFLCLSSFLDKETLQGPAAWAMVKVAMPDPGVDNGLYGEFVEEQLAKCKGLLKGGDSQYIKIDIEDYLKKIAGKEGFVSMFNGENLDGWQGFVTNPIKKKELSKRVLGLKQKEADKKMHECWQAKDEMILFNGKGHNLCSIKEYGDFEMYVDWRITKGGDSGIYLRGAPQVQIWDIALTKVGAQVGSGGLYNNQKNMSKPLMVADNPVGEWNTFHITMVGDKVTVTLNGFVVVDNVTMENYWDRKQPIFPKGPVELQAHGSNLAFKNIYIREIK